MFNANNTCPLAESMAIAPHPFADSEYLELFHMFPIWLQMYLTSLYLNPYLLLPSKVSIIVSLLRQFVIPMMWAYLCRQRVQPVVININSAQTDYPKYVPERLDTIDLEIMHALSRHQEQGLTTRNLQAHLQHTYPELQRGDLNKRLQALLSSRRIQSSTGDLSAPVWFLIKEKLY